MSAFVGTIKKNLTTPLELFSHPFEFATTPYPNQQSNPVILNHSTNGIQIQHSHPSHWEAPGWDPTIDIFSLCMEDSRGDFRSDREDHERSMERTRDCLNKLNAEYIRLLNTTPLDIARIEALRIACASDQQRLDEFSLQKQRYILNRF